MQPVNYEKHCASCHTLQFDRRFSESVPHKEPQVVYDFVHREADSVHCRASGRDSVGRRARQAAAQPSAAAARAQCRRMGAAAHGATRSCCCGAKSCKECHRLKYPEGPRGAARRRKAATSPRAGCRNAEFDHEAHQMVECASCHAKANDSRETSDVLIPGVQTCQQCHHSGKDAAEARCFECHAYHDWSKENRSRQVHHQAAGAIILLAAC